MLVFDNNDLRLRILRLAHDSLNANHSGKIKQYELVFRTYWWPELRNDVRRYVRNCHDCSRSKVSQDKKHELFKSLFVPDRRWAHISINFIVDLSLSLNHFERDYINILVVVDRLFKIIKYILMNKMNVETIVKVFYLWVWKDHDFSIIIIFDRDIQFEFEFWYELCKLASIKIIFSIAFHLEIDDQIERSNAVLKQYLRAYIAFLQNDWAKWLSSAEFSINNHVSKTTIVSSFFANSGQNPRMGFEPSRHFDDPTVLEDIQLRGSAENFATKMLKIDEVLREQITYAQANQNEFANRNRQPDLKYREGDKIWLNVRNLWIEKGRTRKLINKFKDPFKITKVVSSHIYRLELPTDWSCHDVFDITLLRLESDNTLPEQMPPPPIPFPLLKSIDIKYSQSTKSSAPE